MSSEVIANPFMEMLNTMDLYGWTRNQLGNEETGMCFAGLYGHLAKLAPEQFNNNATRVRMTRIVAARLPGKETIFSFNDRLARDDADIRELLKHCASDWDELYG